MKYTIATFSLLFIICFYSSFGQDISKLPNIKSVLTSRSLSDGLAWIMFEGLKLEEYSPKNAEKVSSDIENYLIRGFNTKELDEIELLKEYKANLQKLFSEFDRFGSEDANFFYANDNLPVSFCLYGDSALSVVISGAFIGKMYNTIQLTSKQRATKVITQHILPSFKTILSNLNEKNIQYLCMTAVYGSKDFTQNHSERGEFVAVVARRDLLKKFISTDITEDEFIEKVDVFVTDRNMSGDEIKKIKIIIK